jgi:hypothetical protein
LLDAVDEWLLVARTSPMSNAQALAPLVRLLEKRVEEPARTKLALAELKDLLAQKPVKVWRVDLGTDARPEPAPPPVDFALPEVYSLLPPPET